MSHNPVCVKCQCEMNPERIGIQVVDTTADISPHLPYQLWNADLHKCPKCGIEVVASFGSAPWLNRGERGFSETMAKVYDKKNYVECHYR